MATENPATQAPLPKADATPAGSAGKPPSADAAKREAKAAAPKKASARKAGNVKRQVTKRGDQAPEAGRTAKDRSARAAKMFKDADEAALRGLPPDMTVEQHENHVRRAALGY